MSYGKDPFGFGPYGGLGGVLVPPPNPPNGGYGGAPYGYGSYGSLGGFGSPASAVTGGYGGCAYGTGPYGCIGLDNPPEVISAVSITGYIIEVFFSNEMSPDADLFDPASYTLVDLVGAAPATVLSVEEGVPGVWGPTSVLLHHTGTTLGGFYRVVVVGPRDIGGTAIAAYAPLNQAELLTKGEPPPFTITPISGSELLYEFEYDMLDEAGFSPGILQLDAYGYTTTYPQNLIVTAVEHPYLADPKNVKVDVLGMTSTDYSGIVSPATAISYDATFLPDAPQADFTGQELGNGSTTQGVDEILLNCGFGFSYGWRFIDTSGKLIPNSSYRCDITFDVSRTGLIDPALFDTNFANIIVNDGAVQVSITLKRLAGIDTLEISSGAFFASGSIDWSSSETTISLVRNQKADSYAVVVDDEPFVSGLTVAFTGPSSIPNGCQFLLDPGGVYNIEDFPFLGVEFTATQTVFSTAWNFLHNQNAPFVGDAANTNAFALTGCGPLVKGWGDATPATKQDVSILVNGIPVEVDHVNPYVGKIFPVIPIPLMPPGIMDVTVDYIWFPCPIVEFAGLNTEGLVLNRVDCKPTCNNREPGTGWSSGPLLPGGGKSTPAGWRFPMTVVIGARQTRKPLLRSPRFVGFQKAYTAALNSPTTLLLNRDPHRVALPPEQEMPEGQAIFYDGVEDPRISDPPWVLTGVNDDGFFTTDALSFQPFTPEGVFQIVDASSGSYNEGQVAFYSREIDTSFDSTILIVSRFFVDRDTVNGEGTSVETLDGVFTGVAFGAHTNNHLYVVGALLINDVQHIGMLTDPAFPELRESWSLAYQTPLQILTPTTFQVSTLSLPDFLQRDQLCDISERFQIFVAPQEGTYTVIGVSHAVNGTSIVTIDASNPFPGNPQMWGGAFFNAFFETEWDGGDLQQPTTYRLVIKNDIKNIPKGEAELFIGGVLKGRALHLEGVPPFAIPPDGVLLFPTGDEGEVFWGSISRRATSRSLWSFSHYGLEPAATTIYFRGIVAAAEMNALPEDDPNNIWFLTQEFGSRIIDSTGDQLLLKSTSGIDGVLVEEPVFDVTVIDAVQTGTELVQLNPDLTLGYARIEPFLTRRMAIDVDATFEVNSGILGAGDLIISIKDGTREVRFATILYDETSTRQLLFMENLSLSGLLLPDVQQWTKTGDLTQARVEGQRLQFTQDVGETLTYTIELVESGITPQSESRIIEARIQVESLTTTDVAGDTGIFFGADVGDPLSSRGVGLQLRAKIGGGEYQVFLFSIETGAEVVAFDFDWSDGEIHTYRLLCDVDTNTVSLVLDDTFTGVTDLTNFAISTTATQSLIGFSNVLTETTVQWWDYSTIVTPPLTAKRTLGVWLGGDVDDIDSWEIPRTDSLTVPNSDLSAVIEEMDWRSRIKVRLHRDPAWGITVLRPDLPPPPFFTGDFGPQFTEPSAGWINVEYRNLPSVDDTDEYGFVTFGALDDRSITQQRWDDVRYRIYKYASEDIIMPPHMVLNQYNVITSGEFQKDITVESVEILTTTGTQIWLSQTHIYANRVFTVQWVNDHGDTVTYFPGSFEFDPTTQIISFTTELVPGFQTDLDLPTAEDPFVDWPDLNEFVSLSEAFNPVDLSSVGGPAVPLQKYPVTVKFAPGKPLTNTYICSQPLLDGTTLLNEGTPSVTKSHVGKDTNELTWGSRINDPNDTLNDDPDFILNDPFRFLEFQKDPNIWYENIEFCEVDEGEKCRLSPFCDDSIPGCGGTTPDGGGGDIGNGLIDIAFSGLTFTEVDPISFTDGPTGPFGNLPSSVFLEASGGDAPPGGYLQNTILFTPLGPETPPSQGTDGTVGWSVFGQLYDTVTKTTTIIYFGTEAPPP